MEASLIPGAAKTAAEIMLLYEQGYDFVKFFPAELSGGVAMLKAFQHRYQKCGFLQGGINSDLVPHYRTYPAWYAWEALGLSRQKKSNSVISIGFTGNQVKSWHA